MDITHGEGVHLVLHSGARILTQRSIDVVATGGHLIDLGKTSKLEQLKPGYFELQRENIGFSKVELQHLTYKCPKLTQRLLLEVFDLLEGVTLSDICPILAIPLHSIPRAFQQLVSSQHVGKVVVRVMPEAETKRDTSFSEGESSLIVGGVRYC
jgi:NADPH:quinone reductase-like Zn-dependent oxidoreductase